MTKRRRLPTSPTLIDLAVSINQEHDAAITDAQSAIDHAVACGKLLLKAKGTMKQGEWTQWLEKNTKVSVRQSQRYMKLAKNDTMSHLVIDGAKLLAPPQPQEPTLEKLEQQLVRIEARRESIMQKIAAMRAGVEA